MTGLSRDGVVSSTTELWFSIGSFFFFDALILMTIARRYDWPVAGRQPTLTALTVFCMQLQLLLRSGLRDNDASCESQWITQYVLLMSSLLAYTIRAYVLYFRAEMALESGGFLDELEKLHQDAAAKNRPGPDQVTKPEESQPSRSAVDVMIKQEDIRMDVLHDGTPAVAASSSNETWETYDEDSDDESVVEGAADGNEEAARLLRKRRGWFHQNRYLIDTTRTALFFCAVWCLEVVAMCAIIYYVRVGDYCQAKVAKFAFIVMWWIHACVFVVITVSFPSGNDPRNVRFELQLSSLAAVLALVCMSLGDVDSPLFFFLGQWAPFLIMGLAMLGYPTLISFRACQSARNRAKAQAAGVKRPPAAGEPSVISRRDGSGGVLAASESVGSESRPSEGGGRDAAEDDADAARSMLREQEAREAEDMKRLRGAEVEWRVGLEVQVRLPPGLLCDDDSELSLMDAAGEGAWMEGNVEQIVEVPVPHGVPEGSNDMVLVRGVRQPLFPSVRLAVWAPMRDESLVRASLPGRKLPELPVVEEEFWLSLRPNATQDRFLGKPPYGVFADRPISRGSALMVFNPDIIDGERGPWKLGVKFTLASRIDHRWVAGNSPSGAANTFFFGHPTREVAALRDIDVGEELTADYGYEFWCRVRYGLNLAAMGPDESSAVRAKLKTLLSNEDVRQRFTHPISEPCLVMRPDPRELHPEEANNAKARRARTELLPASVSEDGGGGDDDDDGGDQFARRQGQSRKKRLASGPGYTARPDDDDEKDPEVGSARRRGRRGRGRAHRRRPTVLRGLHHAPDRVAIEDLDGMLRQKVDENNSVEEVAHMASQGFGTRRAKIFGGLFVFLMVVLLLVLIASGNVTV